MTYFAEEFGFTDDQTVAIMGAHTYGGMDEDNSGYFFNLPMPVLCHLDRASNDTFSVECLF